MSTETEALSFVLSGSDHARTFGKDASLEVLQRALDLAYQPRYRASKTLIKQLEREIGKKKKAAQSASKLRQFWSA